MSHYIKKKLLPYSRRKEAFLDPLKLSHSCRPGDPLTRFWHDNCGAVFASKSERWGEQHFGLFLWRRRRIISGGKCCLTKSSFFFHVAVFMPVQNEAMTAHQSTNHSYDHGETSIRILLSWLKLYPYQLIKSCVLKKEKKILRYTY